MKKVILLFGVLLFSIGSVLFIGAYFIFNKYSVSGSHYIEITSNAWQFPESPLELAEGDKVIVYTSMIGGTASGKAIFYIVSSAGEKDDIGQGGNSTLYYYVQKNGLYYCRVEVPYGSFQRTGAFTWQGLTVNLNIEVVSKAPNLLFLLIGITLLLAGAITILSVFLYRKIERSETVKE
jgi:uncharacterized protein YneR